MPPYHLLPTIGVFINTQKKEKPAGTQLWLGFQGMFGIALPCSLTLTFNLN